MNNRMDPFSYSKKIISCHLKSFLRERPGVLHPADIDIEPVHRMRVASRRLREAFNVFKEVLPKEAGTWRKTIRKIGRVLGGGRELDIQIEFLESVLKTLKGRALIKNTQAIIESLRGGRKQAQKEIYRVLVDFKAKKDLPGLKAWLNDHSGRQERLAVAFHAQRGSVVLKRLDRLLKFSAYVDKPRSIKEFHLMRIAAKKLRYTLELLHPWYGTGIDKYVRASRDVQDLLGDLHELDVLSRVLSGFSRKGDSDFSTTVTYLTRRCAVLRRDVYVRFVRRWRHLQARRMWVMLRRTI